MKRSSKKIADLGRGYRRISLLLPSVILARPLASSVINRFIGHSRREAAIYFHQSSGQYLRTEASCLRSISWLS